MDDKKLSDFECETEGGEVYKCKWDGDYCKCGRNPYEVTRDADYSIEYVGDKGKLRCQCGTLYTVRKTTVIRMDE